MINIIEQLAEFLKVLGDKTRIEILDLLKDGEEKKVTTINELLGKSQSSISQQLKILENANLVDSRKEGRNKFYKIKDPQIIKIFTLLNSYISNLNQGKIEELADLDILDTLF